MAVMTRVAEILHGDFDVDFISIFHRINLLLLAVMVLAAGGFWGAKVALGVLLGAGLATVNCWGLDRDCNRLMRWRSMAAYYGGFAVRLGLVVLAVTVIFLFFPHFVSVVGFLVGLSVVIVNFYIWVLGILVFRVLGTKEAA